NSSESSYPNFQKAKGFHSVPPPTGTIIPPRANVSFTGIDELAIRNKVVNQEKTKSSQPEIDRNKVIIEDWVDSDDEETVLNTSEIQKKTVSNSENSETSFENRSPNSQDSVGQVSRNTGFGHKGGKLCFVCYSPNHLIKDCNLHERTFKQTHTHKPKGTQGTRDKRPVWNNIQRVNHSNFSRNSRYPNQRRSFIPSAVLTREGLKSTARPSKTQTVPSKSTANVFYQGTARPKVSHAVLSQSTGRPYYPRMDNTRPRTSRTPHRPQRPKKIVKSIWVKKGSTVGTQAVLPQTVKESVIMKSNQTWKPKGAYLDSVNRDNGSYTLKQFEYVTPLGVSNYVEELKFNLLSVSQICDKKHNVLFTDKECLILSPKFKFVDEDLIHKLKTKLKKLSNGVKPLVKHHILLGESQSLWKRERIKRKGGLHSNWWRNKDEVIIEEEKILLSKKWDTEELDLERIPNLKIIQYDEFLADNPRKSVDQRGLSIAVLCNLKPQQPTQLRPKRKERRYPLSRELMIRMLDHGMEVEDESETAITLIHLFILWTTEDGDDS
ncbi:hypothetical protein Tco_0942872, partial [Tanacetum coccineum]